jgi:hypothetical protein
MGTPDAERDETGLLVGTLGTGVCEGIQEGIGEKRWLRDRIQCSVDVQRSISNIIS